MLFIKPLIKKLLKQRVKKPIVPIKKAKKVAILSTFHNSELFEKIKLWRAQFEYRQAKVVHICFFPKAHDIFPETKKHAYCFSKNNFSLFGKTKKQYAKLEKVQTDDYDFLLHLDFQSHEYTDFLLARLKAKYKIGVFDENREAFYDLMLMIDKDKSFDYLWQQVTRYLQLIK